MNSDNRAAVASMEKGPTGRPRTIKLAAVAVALSLAAVLGLFHRRWLNETTIAMRLLPVGEVGSANPKIDVFVNGKLVRSVGVADRFEVPIRRLGKAELYLSSRSFDEIRRGLDIHYGVNDLGEIYLTPSTGLLSIDTEPAGAEVTLIRSGTIVARSPKERLLRLPVGDYEIKAEIGVASAIRNVTIAKDTSVKTEVVIPRGTIEISGSPCGGTYTVACRGRKIAEGSYPGQLVDVEPGDYKVEFLFGGVKLAKELVVMAGRVATAVGDFPIGQLAISSNPANVAFVVSRDGEKLRTGHTPVELMDLPEGRYLVECVNAGESKVEVVEVARNLRTAINIAFPVGNLEVSVTGSVKSAVYRITRGGSLEQTGTAPARFVNVKIGNLDVEATDGSFVLRKMVTISAGKTAVVPFDFTYGRCSVESQPAGASVEMKMDGQVPLRGVTPFAPTTAILGEYAVVLTFKGTRTEGHLTLRAGETAKSETKIIVGGLVITPEMPGAVYDITSLSGTYKEDVRADSPTELPVGSYRLRIVANGIASERNVKIEPGDVCKVNPFDGLGRIRVVSNMPNTRVDIRSNNNRLVAFAGISPVEFVGVPYGSYTVRWQIADGSSKEGVVNIEHPEQEISFAFRRSVHSIKDKSFWAINRFPIVIARYPRDFKRVWQAVYEQFKSEMGRKEEPWRVDEANGYIIGKRRVPSVLGAMFSLSDTQMFYDHAVTVTDILDAVEVQIVTEIWIFKSKIGQPPDFSDENFSPNYDSVKSRELSEEFLRGLRARLKLK